MNQRPKEMKCGQLGLHGTSPHLLDSLAVTGMLHELSKLGNWMRCPVLLHCFEGSMQAN
jgi:hypothetical protein